MDCIIAKILRGTHYDGRRDGRSDGPRSGVVDSYCDALGEPQDLDVLLEQRQKEGVRASDEIAHDVLAVLGADRAAGIADSGSSCGPGGVLLKFPEILDPAIDALSDRVEPGRLISIELLGGNEEAATIDGGSDP